MQINLKNTHQQFPTLSPIFQQSPFFSPLPEETLRKYSYNYDQFVSFRLQACDQQIDLLYNFQQIQIQLNPINFISEQENKNQPINTTNKYQEKNHQNSKMQDIESEQKIQKSQIQKSSIQNILKYPHTANSLQHLIQFLIQNIYKDEIQLKKQALQANQQFSTYSAIIQILIGKFKKSKKTKEQMIKYCMRKAFKFIADKMKKNRTHNRDIDSCMKIYFSKNQLNQNFSIPFKKNSTQKTMNGSFLKRVFSSNSFLIDYRQFLDEFQSLMGEDNYKKVKYLAQLIQENIKNGQIEKIQKIKRLPWNQETLEQTLQLSQTLIQYADKDTVNNSQ